METQAEISRGRLKEKIASGQEVIIDEVFEDGAIARSHADAPEIDGLVHIRDGAHLQAGMITRVTIERSDDHDLYARLQTTGHQ